MPLNIQAELNENTTCNCWRDECSRDLCPCMQIQCDDEKCNCQRGCIQGDCTCLGGGECD